MGVKNIALSHAMEVSIFPPLDVHKTITKKQGIKLLHKLNSISPIAVLLKMLDRSKGSQSQLIKQSND